MTQRKQHTGKPGNRPGKGSQQFDKKGKSPGNRNSGKPPREGRDDRRRDDRPQWLQKGPETSRKERRGGSARFESDMAAPHPANRRDRHPQETDRPHREPRGHGGEKGQSSYWLFGHHAVGAALANPDRRIQRLVQLSGGPDHDGAETNILAQAHPNHLLPPLEPIDRNALERLLPPDAVHQGIAARVAPLPETDLYEICDLATGLEQATVMILDQVTDPHNVGAILRSAAAFGALAVILTERHAAPESGTLAKSASGALEHVPLVRVGNLARAMEQLKEAGFWLAGLAAEGKTTLAAAKLSGKVGLVMGAEGPGLRRLTRDHCDLLVRLPTGGPIGHLNVSNAAAVALYELVRDRA